MPREIMLREASYRSLTCKEFQEIVRRAKDSIRREEMQRIREHRPRPEEPSIDSETLRFYHDF